MTFMRTGSSNLPRRQEMTVTTIGTGLSPYVALLMRMRASSGSLQARPFRTYGVPAFTSCSARRPFHGWGGNGCWRGHTSSSVAPS